MTNGHLHGISTFVFLDNDTITFLPPGVSPDLLDDSDTNFAAQIIAGVAYDVSENTALTLDTRYSRAFDVSSDRLAPNGALTGTVEDDIDAFSINFGVRQRF